MEKKRCMALVVLFAFSTLQNTMKITIRPTYLGKIIITSECFMAAILFKSACCRSCLRMRKYESYHGKGLHYEY